MDQNETQWDRLLKIKTTGRDDSHSDQYRYPYEPTQYCVLERLAHSGLIGKKNVLLDYGTGKGRVCFYLSYQEKELFLNLSVQKIIRYRQRWTDAIFLIRFR